MSTKRIGRQILATKAGALAQAMEAASNKDHRARHDAKLKSQDPQAFSPQTDTSSYLSLKAESGEVTASKFTRPGRWGSSIFRLLLIRQWRHRNQR